MHYIITIYWYYIIHYTTCPLKKGTCISRAAFLKDMYRIHKIMGQLFSEHMLYEHTWNFQQMLCSQSI